MARRTRKEIIISKIKRIIEEWGSFSVADVEHESSPIINSTSKNSVTLAERFNSSDVDVVHYVHEAVVSEDSIDYEGLPTDTLEDILSIAENYVVDMDKTMERCRG